MTASAGLRLSLGYATDHVHAWFAQEVGEHGREFDPVHDVNQLPWPWGNDQVDEIQLLDIADRVPKLLPVLDECWRVLKPHGCLRLRVPHFELVSAATGRRARRTFHRESFDCLDPDLADSADCPFQTPRKWWLTSKDVVDGNVIVEMYPRKDTRLETGEWRTYTWAERLAKGTEEILDAVPDGATFVLADQEEWGMGDVLEGRRRLPFPELDGYFAGAPLNDDHAIAELERLRAEGARFFALAWPVSWWLHHYAAFRRYLQSNYRCVAQGNRVTVFDLSRDPGKETASSERLVTEDTALGEPTQRRLAADACGSGDGGPPMAVGPFRSDTTGVEPQLIPRFRFTGSVDSSMVIVSGAVGAEFEEMLSLMAPTVRYYAALHGMDCVLVPGMRFGTGRPSSWEKLVAIRSLLDKYQSVMWIDSDAIIRDPSRDIRLALDPTRYVHLVPHYVKGNVIPNAGVWVIRRHPLSIDLLERMWQSTDCIDHIWWEQAALLRLIGYEPFDVACAAGEPTEFTRIVQLLGLEWNSIPDDMAADPVIVHFTRGEGLAMRERLAGLRRELGEFLGRVATRDRSTARAEGDPSASDLAAGAVSRAPLHELFSLIENFDPATEVLALDRNHNLFLVGALLSRKPARVLELGIGTGYVTSSLLYGLRYNGTGTLTCVDNWCDSGGVEPSGADALRAAGVTIVAPVAEGAFVKQCESDAFDFLVSDADHKHSGSWIDEHLRIVRHDGFMFFHDTNQPEEYPNLQLILRRVEELGLPHYHFTSSTRTDERCERGWLFVINKKARAV